MAAILVGLNYHRIGVRDPDNPFHRLHTVAREVFEAEIGHAQALGPFVTLDAVAAGEVADGVSFLLTFDDVSATVEGVRPWLAAEGVPFHVCPATGITDAGQGTRDKVNWILARLAPGAIAAGVREAFGPDAEAAMAAKGFYRFSKGTSVAPAEMEARVIEPLYANALSAGPAPTGTRPYLAWDDLARAYAGAEGIGLVNHGAAHRRLDALSDAEIAADLDAAEAAFKAGIGTIPRDYAVPFGDFKPGLARRLEAILTLRGYRTALWVDRRANVLPEGGASGRFLHLGRLHVPDTLESFVARLERAIASAHILLAKN